jgi:ribosomal protein S19
MDTITRNCAECKTDFEMLYKYRNQGRKFCSVSCGAKSSARAKYKDSSVQLNCEHCSKEFVVTAFIAKTRKYCSDPCKREAQKVPAPHFDCKQCGKNFTASRKQSGSWNYDAKYCSRECVKNSQRKEGWCTDKHGYKYAVFNGKQVFEHRAIMESMIGRKLAPEETVHHINGDRADNRPANLELWSSRHGKGQRVSDKVAFAVSLLQQYPEYLEEQGFCLTKSNNNIVNLSYSRKEIGK